VSGGPAADPLACPGCGQPMQTRRFDAHYERAVDLDLCHGCGLIWFDARESIALTPGAVLRLFAALDQHRDQRHPLAGSAMHCPRCRRLLQATVDRQRATLFSYWWCPGDDGRLTTFFDFLREKNFVRPLSPERLAELRRYTPTVNCSACGAPVDLARESACPHCRAPLSMLDPDQVHAVVRELQEAEQRRTTVDPTLAARLAADRLAVERDFRASADIHALDLRGSFGVVEAGLSALARLIADPPDLSAP
jgi:uncharacterized protein YbaR (Trm112 family)